MMTIRPRSNLGLLLVIPVLIGLAGASNVADKDAEADTAITFCLRGPDGPLVCSLGRHAPPPGRDFLQEDLQRRAEEFRKKLEGQQK